MAWWQLAHLGQREQADAGREAGSRPHAAYHPVHLHDAHVSAPFHNSQRMRHMPWNRDPKQTVHHRRQHSGLRTCDTGMPRCDASVRRS